MRIDELENAPKWLRDARTRNADVEIKNSVVIWHDGLWLDGVWHGGVWYDGEWRGGVWFGGEWRCGEWYDGEWRDGEWRGGEWYDGVWHGGKLLGERSGLPPLNINGLRWTVTISDTRMRIGCQDHSIVEWRGFDNDDVVAMHPDADEFWGKYRDALLSIAETRGNYE